MKTIIAGSRGITDYRTVFEAIRKSGFVVTELVSGCAKGVDSIGESWAHCRAIPVKQFHANWNKFGKSAGVRRNVAMAEYADALIAVWDGKSRGTRHMIETAQKRGLKVHVTTIKQ